MGAVIAFFFKIPKKWNCALLAYGSGALLFALTVEIFGTALHDYEDSIDRMNFFRFPFSGRAIGWLVAHSPPPFFWQTPRPQ